MSEPGKAIGRALDCAGEFKRGKRRGEVESSRQNARRHDALLLIRGMLGVDQPSHRGERVL